MEDFFPRCEASEPGKLFRCETKRKFWSGVFEKKKTFPKIFLSGVKVIDFWILSKTDLS